jgi:Tfp pilus assembly protein PilE
VIFSDSTDCLPHGVEVSAVKYCSNSDSIKITVKDTAVPIPISAYLSKVACPSATEEVEQVAAGACTSDEQTALSDPQNVGKKANDCGTSSYNIFTGKFNHGKFNDCFSASAGISATCSECYVATGEYGAKNCKADCILGWCKSGCLSCTEPAQETLATCTGFASGTAQPCDQVTEQVTAGACTSDEQAALGDPQNVGKKANDCGTSSYNIFTGKFNHGKFNDCFSASAGISATCAECYAATGEYGAKNCKADCLLGWCKSGCLSCTEPAQETLVTCTGFASGTAQPCDEVTV